MHPVEAHILKTLQVLLEDMISRLMPGAGDHVPDSVLRRLEALKTLQAQNELFLRQGVQR